MKRAFTLAEVLITLGIIGVVCALTIPSVITNYQQKKTVSYIKKFYNEINNAIRMSVVDNGDADTWMPVQNDNYYQENLNFLKTYILPYMKYDHYEKCDGERVCTYLTYGMFSLRIDGNGGDIVYFINSKVEKNPRNSFNFQYNKKNTANANLANKPVVEPYAFRWNGSYDDLITNPYLGCNSSATVSKYVYCTKLIQMNNWEITKDYPWHGK